MNDMTDTTLTPAGHCGSATRHKHFGPALPHANWVPAPRYLLRRDRVMRHVRNLAPCRVLDIGCGPAALLSELAAQGFEAYGVDRSRQALKLAGALNTPAGPMTLVPELDPDWKSSFDLIMSFEVIEHLEQDIEAMREWQTYLKPGGRLILSTPAHPSRWNAADVWAGHVRRYTKELLIRSIQDAGYTVETVECYGFPLANIMEHWRARAYGKMLKTNAKIGKTLNDLTDESGSDRSVESRFWPLFSSIPAVAAMRVFCQLQRPFVKTELGNGFLVVARKI